MERVRAALGPSVRVAQAELALWPLPLSVTLDGVAILAGDGSVAASAAHVRCRVRVRSLLIGEPALAAATIDGLAATITRDQVGQYHLGGRPLGSQDRSPSRPGLDAEMPPVRVRRGAITLRDDAAPGRRVELREVDVDVEPLRPGARISATASSPQWGRVRAVLRLQRLQDLATAPFHIEAEAVDASAEAVREWAPARLGDLAAAGRLRGTLAAQGQVAAAEAALTLQLTEGALTWHGVAARAPVQLSGQVAWAHAKPASFTAALNASHVEHQSLAAGDVQATIALENSTPVLTGARWRACGGAWQQTGRIVLSEPPRLQGAVIEVENADGQALLAAVKSRLGESLRAPVLTGPVRFRMTADGVLGAEIAAHVEAALPSGSVTWPPARALAPISLSADGTWRHGSISLDNGRASAARLDAADIAARAVEARFTYAKGALALAPLTAKAFGGAWTAAGTLPWRGGTPSGTLQARGVNAGQLARAVLSGTDAAPDATGTVDATATLTADGAGALDVRLTSPTLKVGDIEIYKPASARAALRSADGRVRVVDGHADLGSIRVGDVAARALHTRFATTGDALRVGPLTASALGGTWTLDATASRAEVSGAILARSVDLNALVAGGAPPAIPPARGDVQAQFRRPRGGALAATVDATLTDGRFQWRGLAIDAPASANGEIQRDGDLVIRNASAKAAAASYGPLHGTDATAQFGVLEKQLHFTNLRFASCGGQWQYTGTAGLSRPHALGGTLDITGADGRALFNIIDAGGSPLDIERVDLHGQFTAEVIKDWRPTLVGSGRLAVQGGSLPSTGFLTAILEKISPSRTATEQAQRANELIAASQTFAIVNGVVHTDDLAVDTHDFSLTGFGTIGLDQRLDLDTRVTLTARGIGAMLDLGGLTLPTGVLPSLPPIPMHMGGTLAHPVIRATTTGLPEATVGWLADSLFGLPGRIGDFVGGSLDSMFDAAGAEPTPAATAPQQ